MLTTPVKNPRRSKANPKEYELAYRQHILFTDETNKTDIYDIRLYPDLWEEGHTRGEPNYARLDVSLFNKYRTEMNMMAKVVRTEAGGYLSMSANLSMRRLFYMHQ